MNVELEQMWSLKEVNATVSTVKASIENGMMLLGLQGLIIKSKKGITKNNANYIKLTVRDTESTVDVYMWDCDTTDLKVGQSVYLIGKGFGENLSYVKGMATNVDPQMFLKHAIVPLEERKALLGKCLTELNGLNRPLFDTILNILNNFGENYWQYSTANHSDVGGFSEYQYRALKMYEALNKPEPIVLASLFLLDMNELECGYIGVPISVDSDNTGVIELSETFIYATEGINLLNRNIVPTVPKSEVQHLQHIICVVNGLVEPETSPARVVSNIKDLVQASNQI